MLPAHAGTIHHLLGSRANANVSLCNMAPSDTSIFRRFTFEDSDSRAKFFERFNSTAVSYTYAVHLFDQFGEKALNDFVPEYLVPKLSTRQIHHRQGRSRSSSIYSLAKHLGAADEDWYPGYHPTWTRKTKGGVCYGPPSRRFQRTMSCFPRRR
jgi:hypothetical protein